MILHTLPSAVEVGGVSYPIVNGGDYRAILDVLSIMKDQEIPEHERMPLALRVFYCDDLPDDLQEASRVMGEFLGGGPQMAAQSSGDDRLEGMMDWEHDFHLIAAAMQRLLGYDVRAVERMHWWTFLSAYMEIPSETTFAYVIGIRRKLLLHQKLEKDEHDYLINNRAVVDIMTPEGQDAAAWLNEDD